MAATGAHTAGPAGCHARWGGCFRDTWDNIYVPRGTGWDANPWVWVADFKMAVTP